MLVRPPKPSTTSADEQRRARERERKRKQRRRQRAGHRPFRGWLPAVIVEFAIDIGECPARANVDDVGVLLERIAMRWWREMQK